MQSMVGVQFSRPPSPSRCTSIGSCQSFTPIRRVPKVGYPSLHFLVYPAFKSFRKLTKFAPISTSASHSEYARGEELNSLQVREQFDFMCIFNADFIIRGVMVESEDLHVT